MADPLTDMGVGVATEATKRSLAKIIQHIGYILKYNENLKSLKELAEKLHAKRNDETSFVQDSNRKLKVVSETVVHWRLEADELYKNANENISKNNISCLNLWSRYSASKNAWKMAREIDQMVHKAPDFGTSFDAPASKLGAKFNLAGFMEFKSRASLVNDVLMALKEVSMCSIVGMGGTGKTTLAKILVQKVEDDRLFDKVAMVTVSEQPNFERIQTEIIELLGLKIDERSMPARANKLNAWLSDNKRKTLLILDDVWWRLKNEDFENIGIPIREGSCSCKVVVTSRNENECKKMGSQRIFPIKFLDDEEGWDLFKHIAGKCVEYDHDSNLVETAKKIANKCGGLPMVIVTLAAALKHEIKATWNDTLVKLQNLITPLEISEVDQVYARIQLSYDLLKDKEAQSCFRLCSLFPEDHNIPIEHLVWFGKGLQLFDKVESMRETRDRVESKIDKLKKSFLLLDGDKDGYVKMHDVLRDFAISISSYVLGFEKVMKKWPETTDDQYKNCSAISFICDKINEHPIDLRCPKLELLQMLLDDSERQPGLPNGIFEGLNELKVLVLKVPSSLPSLTTLTKLRTLIMGDLERLKKIETLDYDIGHLLGHGGDHLKNLEIFIVSRCKPCDDFPVEIGQLCNLRHLSFRYVEYRHGQFKYIAPGVLSKLVKLEELELPPWFKDWGRKEEGDGERVNASLDEINSLPLLTTLKIGVAKGSVFEEKLVQRLTRFHVFIGSTDPWSDEFKDSNARLEVFEVDAICDIVMVGWISGLMSKCESLLLRRVSNIRCLISLRSTFPQLKEIDIKSCGEMEYLIDTIGADRRIDPSSSFFAQLNRLVLFDMYGLKEIWRGPNSFSKARRPMCFSNLSYISIDYCRKLKHVFPLSVAIELRQLQSIKI